MTDRLTQLLQTVLEHPVDDGPRLVYADWLEEHGQGERAEFIRVQVELAVMEVFAPSSFRNTDEAHMLRRRADELLAQHEAEWVQELERDFLHYQHGRKFFFRSAGEAKFHWRRGFIHQVECTLETWRGRACPEQYGEGWHKSPDYVSDKWVCPTCHGVGRVGGIGPLLVRGAPIESVVVTDKRPASVAKWHGWAFETGIELNVEQRTLPHEIWDSLTGWDSDDPPLEGWISGWKWYPSADAANAALSATLLKEARETPLPESAQNPVGSPQTNLT